MMKLFSQLIKTAPLMFAILLFYLGLGLFAGIFHGVSGSFSAVRGTDPSSSAAVSSTVVGQIFVPEVVTVAADSSSGETSPEESDTDTDAGTDALNGEILSGEGDRHYYRFVTTTRYQRLHLRTAPSLTAEIIDRLPKGTTGYVIAPGTDWSYIQTDDGQTGYCFNGYLELTELAPEDYPDELKAVTPPVAP